MIDHQQVKNKIIKVKQNFALNPQQAKLALQQAEELVNRQLDIAHQAEAKGEGIIPQIRYEDIEKNQVPTEQIDRIFASGCVSIRGHFPRSLAETWNLDVIAYIEENDYIGKMPSRLGLDTYFSTLGSSRPQIYSVYWSKPQMEARQHPRMAVVKRFLNRLWQMGKGQEFNPDQDFTYADRARRRRPGDQSLGLSPHMDTGSVERWIDPAYQKIYQAVIAGKPQSYNPWLADHRTETVEIPSPAVCSMFRSFQGWTALTPQGKGDGTLMVVPSAHSISYMLLRAFQEDVAHDDLCGAIAGKALAAAQPWHKPVLNGIASIPHVEPGDSMWWHPDIIHAVEDNHTGTNEANVIYIGASPDCDKNKQYAQKQYGYFIKGESPPDFAAENYEVDFKNRAEPFDLNDIGIKQMMAK